MDHIVDTTPGNALGAEAGAQFSAQTLAFTQMYSALARDAIALKVKLFDVTIKCHMLCHCADQGEHFHPKLSWCYSGEDFMRHSKKLFLACVKAVKEPDVIDKFILKYLYALHHAFNDKDEWFR